MIYDAKPYLPGLMASLAALGISFAQMSEGMRLFILFCGALTAAIALRRAWRNRNS